MSNNKPLSFEDGIHPTRAAEITGLSKATLFAWVKAGVTSYGLDLGTLRHGKHLLIPADKVRIIAELNKTYPLPRHGFLAQEQFDELKRAARRYDISAGSTPQP